MKADILAVKFIPNVSADLAVKLELKEEQRSIGMITCSIDDAGYTALDEATKKAMVDVVYAKSFYAGAAHASGPLSGEFIGILAGPTPAEVKSGMEAAITCLETEAFFYTADEQGLIAFYPHVISRTGSYLSKTAGIQEGQPLAYLIAPPLESTFAVDAALKAADVEMKVWFGPPSETNFGGALLTGTQSSCTAAADAFKEAVLSVARSPRDI
ncbi:ethanolamine utilization microcompartment protein EutL [Desulfotomaculum sp. 1211_IL3151]|uniref:ethanolamine utilization microcompartment protein EutL n=1 Tax=Desulfotomaculum sp. 1211_IL3151 TaxID=3084055 RepID=UPI002FDA01FD